ncbi:MAG: ABC transporter ATP-binding protein [Lachnospiraceae bacterium]|nr:ABC transporter ATP-binding protein [Lachnospiraceae bacterium]
MELRAEKISREYFRKGRGTNVFTAVYETDLLLAGGSLTEIEGRSGSGKSTLLNMAAGLLTPSSGRVLLDGEDLYAMDDAQRAAVRNRKMGIIPQGQTTLRALTVLENVLLPADLYKKQSPDRKKAEELLGLVGIGDLANVYPDELSGGERRRLAVARALMNDPGVVLADEPTADLDDENTRLVLQVLRDLSDRGTAVLLVTHEPEAERYADTVYRMNGGHLERV